ncbi:hypothetical protein OA408_00410 [Acidimicrobiaceae bacterium]|nr:hypothetical protein [Acidimicrobiaceae bacterium]
MFHQNYHIEGTDYINPEKIYSDPETYPSFQKNLINFQEKIIEDSSEMRNSTFYKYGDGDYYLLKNQHRGTAKPGMRDTYKYKILNPSTKYLNKMSQKSNYYMSLLQFFPEFKESFNRTPDFLAEYAYGLIANKWFFKNFTKIGLIGSNVKLDIIEKLMNNQEYKEYLSVENFETYIKIPQTYALSKSKYIYKEIGKQIQKSDAEIFLLGVGLSQNILLPKLQPFSKRPLISVGVGLDAISGCVNINRPYFGGWINYRLKDANIYEKINDVTMKTTQDKDKTIFI